MLARNQASVIVFPPVSYTHLDVYKRQAEAVARNAVGTITLVDLDNIAESNVNRQLHALDGAFGQAKVTAMAERIKLRCV